MCKGIRYEYRTSSQATRKVRIRKGKSCNKRVDGAVRQRQQKRRAQCATSSSITAKSHSLSVRAQRRFCSPVSDPRTRSEIQKIAGGGGGSQLACRRKGAQETRTGTRRRLPHLKFAMREIGSGQTGAGLCRGGLRL